MGAAAVKFAVNYRTSDAKDGRFTSKQHLYPIVEANMFSDRQHPALDSLNKFSAELIIDEDQQSFKLEMHCMGPISEKHGEISSSPPCASSVCASESPLVTFSKT